MGWSLEMFHDSKYNLVENLSIILLILEYLTSNLVYLQLPPLSKNGLTSFDGFQYQAAFHSPFFVLKSGG
jgi:hypothetical protein